MKTKAAILLVNRDCGLALKKTLENVLDTAGREAEVLVIDDGSRDGSREILRALPGIRLIEKERRGILPAMNDGFRLAGRQDVVRIQPGMALEPADWLDRLQTLARGEPHAGIVGVKSVFADHRILSCGRRLVCALGIRDHHCNLGHGEMDRGQYDQVRELDGTLGTTAYYRRDVLDAVGGVDEQFSPLWWEDDDLCMAARAKGFTVYLQPTVRATILDAPYERPYPPPVKVQALQRHALYWETKWGWNPEFPDLHRIRERWGHTGICWGIGEALEDEWPGDEPAVDILMVTWNNRPGLERCLSSLQHTRYPRARLWILDNGTSDGTEALLAESRSRLASLAMEVQRTPVNIGLPAAMNWLIQVSAAPLVARLDDDVVLEPDWLAKMVEDLRRHPYAGVVGAKVNDLEKPNQIQFADYRLWPQLTGHEGETDAGQHDRLLLSNHVRGCALLYRRKAIEKAGAFDIRYSPSQWDDPDHHVALRTAGYDILYDGRLRVLHPLTNGADRSRKAVSNSQANFLKLLGKWGNDVFEVLERGLDLAGRENTHAREAVRAAGA